MGASNFQSGPPPVEVQDRAQLLLDLEDELLLGGVALSEWTVRIVEECDEAFVLGLHIACLILALSAIECHLRFESEATKSTSLYLALERAGLKETLRDEVQELRKYRNRWVHVSDPSDDGELQNDRSIYDKELEEAALRSIIALRKVLFHNPWI